jgi:hypothetical protein
MADWTTLPNTAVGVGGLPSGTTVTALRDNPVAIAEGAPGAPRVQGVALGGIRQSRVSATGNSYVTILNLGNYGWVDLHCAFSSNSSTGTRSVRFQASTDNGANWSSDAIVGLFVGLSYNGFRLSFGLLDGVLLTTTDGEGYSLISGGPFNAIRIRQSSDSSSGNVLQVVPYFMEART